MDQVRDFGGGVWNPGAWARNEMAGRMTKSVSMLPTTVTTEASGATAPVHP